jgi:hypothetical protein
VDIFSERIAMIIGLFSKYLNLRPVVYNTAKITSDKKKLE